LKESLILIVPIFIPIIAGILLLCLTKIRERKYILLYTGTVLVTMGLLMIGIIFGGESSYTLFVFMEKIPVIFHLDLLGMIFATIVTVIWIGTGFYAFGYMKHEHNERRYFGFYLITYGVLIGVVFAGNIITLYGFYEFMTIVSVPLVMHSLSKEAIMAGLKYLFYSFCGAYMALYGIFFLYQYTDTLTFQAGGTLNMELVAGNESILLIGIFLMIMGFGVKAGMFPFHGWLPTAHPVAPSPASAVLSTIIVKMGVFAIIRTVYYLVGTEFLSGTWVQYTWLTLTLITIFMGSMLAYKENIIKKRLAYSTVSQVSYILFGLALLTPIGYKGAILHIIFHSFIKSILFLVAGCIIYKTKKTKVDEIVGIGKEMPITMWCYTLASLALIGIPLTSGFISKWYLATGSLASDIPVVSWLGPVVLLISALLTAGYLLPIMIKGFFPGTDYNYENVVSKEANRFMLFPIIFFTFIAIILGMIPNQVLAIISQIITEAM